MFLIMVFSTKTETLPALNSYSLHTTFKPAQKSSLTLRPAGLYTLRQNPWTTAVPPQRKKVLGKAGWHGQKPCQGPLGSFASRDHHVSVPGNKYSLAMSSFLEKPHMCYSLSFIPNQEKKNSSEAPAEKTRQVLSCLLYTMLTQIMLLTSFVPSHQFLCLITNLISNLSI